MKIGILGTGFGAYHAELYRQMDEVDEVLVFGRSAGKLQELEEKRGICTTTNIDDILDNPEIELVDVCLPSELHREYVIKALEKGKHVYCETPVALKAEDAAAMLEAERKYQKKVFVNLFLRFEYPYQYLYQIKQNRQYGRLLSLRIQRKTPPLWGDLAVDKITTNLMIHDIDLTSWLLGAPNHVQACSVNGSHGQSAVTALLKYDNTMAEVIGSSMMAGSYPFAVSYEAVLEKAVLSYYEDGYRDHSDEALTLFTEEGKLQMELPKRNCYETAIQHVMTCINGDTVGINRLDQAADSLELALRIHELVNIG